MHLYSVTIPQRYVKYQLSMYFFSQILHLPNETELSKTETRWYVRPPYVISHCVDPGAQDQPKGGFTGVQFNVCPPKELRPIVSALRAIGIKQPEPHKVDDSWLLPAFDPTGNQIVLVATDEPPDEPLKEKGLGSLSVFVTDVKRAREFYLNALGLPLRAEPYEGLVVIGDRSGASLMIYQSTKANPTTPIGRTTGISFYTPEMPQMLSAIVRAGGMVLHQTPAEDGTGEFLSAEFSDPERNTFTVFNEHYLALPAQPVEEVKPAASTQDNALGLELDAGQPVQPSEAEEGYVFNRDLELD